MVIPHLSDVPDRPFECISLQAARLKAELILGHPIFPGESGVDQLVEIIKAGQGLGSC